MNYFFGFDSTGQYEFIYNLNHLILLLLVAGTLAAMYFGLTNKSPKGVRCTKIVLASVMAFFEGGRYIFIMVQGITTYGYFSWLSGIPFSMCGIMSLTTIAVLYISAFRKTNGRVMEIMFNILFGCAMMGGILTFTSPQMVDGRFSLLHFRNLQTITIHVMLIFVPIYLIKIGELQVRLKNFWMVAVGYLSIGIISMTGSQISGRNFAYALYVDLLVEHNIYIPFPWHLPPMFLAMLVIPAIYYLVFDIVQKKRNPLPRGVAKVKQFSRRQWVVLGCSFLLSFALIILIPSLYSVSPMLSGWGLLSAIPLVVVIAGVWVAHKKLKEHKHD